MSQGFSHAERHLVTLMEAFADAQEDERPDDGAIEIDSDEEYTG